MAIWSAIRRIKARASLVAGFGLGGIWPPGGMVNRCITATKPFGKPAFRGVNCLYGSLRSGNNSAPPCVQTMTGTCFFCGPLASFGGNRYPKVNLDPVWFIWNIADGQYIFRDENFSQCLNHPEPPLFPTHLAYQARRAGVGRKFKRQKKTRTTKARILMTYSLYCAFHVPFLAFLGFYPQIFGFEDFSGLEKLK